MLCLADDLLSLNRLIQGWEWGVGTNVDRFANFSSAKKSEFSK